MAGVRRGGPRPVRHAHHVPRLRAADGGGRRAHVHLRHRHGRALRQQQRGTLWPDTQCNLFD